MTRAHRSVLILTTVTVLAAGMTAQTLTEPAGAGADIQLAASAILLVISGTLLLRVMRHLSRTPHHNAGRVPAARQPYPPAGTTGSESSTPPLMPHAFRPR